MTMKVTVANNEELTSLNALDVEVWSGGKKDLLHTLNPGMACDVELSKNKTLQLHMRPVGAAATNPEGQAKVDAANETTAAPAVPAAESAAAPAVEGEAAPQAAAADTASAGGSASETAASPAAAEGLVADAAAEKVAS